MSIHVHDRTDAISWLSSHNGRSIYPISLYDQHGRPWPDPNSRSISIVRRLLKAGALKVEVQYFAHDDRPSEDTIFVSLPPVITKQLLWEIVALDPDAFTEVYPNVFRLRWD